jgi:hypothetical protein
VNYTCGHCGKEHSELSRYTMWREPDLMDSESELLEFDSKFTCRIENMRYFVSCEVEVPFTEPSESPLGFICWVEVSERDYERYTAYRGRKKERGGFKELIAGRLANSVPAIPLSLGTAVKFKVLKGDPTPYVKWVEPETTLAQRIEVGATNDFWHEALGLSESGAEG